MKSKLYSLRANCLLLPILLANVCLAQPTTPAILPLTHSTNAAVIIAAQVARLDHDRILKLAGRALALKPVAITDFVATNSAGGPHDFFSQMDYAWPNPNTTNGLPYVYRDGETYPEIFVAHRMAIRQLKDAVAALTAAYVLTGDNRYAAKSAELLRVFMLDPDTRMNPQFQHSQTSLGKDTGVNYGIIDGLHLVEVATAVPFLEKSPAFPPSVDKGVKQWFADLTQWIATSTNGVKEQATLNNHSDACFVQLAAYAKLNGDEKVAAMARQKFKTVLFPNQMTNNGSFPQELARTKPYGYSIFQADTFTTLCMLLSTPSEDLWRFTLPDGRTPGMAVEFIYPYLADKNKWLADGRGKDVMHWEGWPSRQPCLLFAYVKTGDEKYFDLWRRLDADPVDLEVRRNMAITQPLLWVASPDQIPLMK